MKRLIYSSATYFKSFPNTEYYRAVPAGADPLQFRPYELGIHCGSLEQAQEFVQTKHRGNGDIYRITLSPDCSYSLAVSDFDVWNSIEAITDILVDGFGCKTDRGQVTADYRNGVLDRNDAANYILDEVGIDDAIVVYHNAVELSEDDIIVLNPDSIVSIEQIQS